MNPTRSGEPWVLVVEDHCTSRLYLTAALLEIGCSVKAAGDIGEAVGTALDWLPDIVLTDWYLPDGSGGELVRRLRELWPEDRPFTRTVLVTGEAPGHLPRGVTSLFASVLQKPCSPRELAGAVAPGKGTEVKEPLPCTGHRLQGLLRSELLQRIPEMERQLGDGNLGAVGGAAHQLVASAALCKEIRLESALRALEESCKSPPQAGVLAARWCALSRAAGDCLAGAAGRP